ncbi:MAG: hypothetical protein KAW40_03870 [Candidatus Aenigmarchaeota archaeon]|nr:hypothetical protein [Candidatus Aenigmarchaeota archaeon]
MGVLEEIIKNKEELLMKIMQILEGKETKTKVNLDGVEFNIGNSKISVHGNVEFTIVPFVKKK